MPATPPKPSVCPTCKGRGWTIEPRSDDDPLQHVIARCRACNPERSIYDNTIAAELAQDYLHSMEQRIVTAAQQLDVLFLAMHAIKPQDLRVQLQQNLLEMLRQLLDPNIPECP